MAFNLIDITVVLDIYTNFVILQRMCFALSGYVPNIFFFCIIHIKSYMNGLISFYYVSVVLDSSHRVLKHILHVHTCYLYVLLTMYLSYYSTTQNHSHSAVPFQL